MQVLNNILTVVDRLMENSITELLGSSQIQQASSSRILQALDNFVKTFDSIYAKQKKKPFDLRNLTLELPNVVSSINRHLFTHDVFFVALRQNVNVSVRITTDNTLARITSETLAVIKIPKETFTENPGTLYSFCFTKPSLFLTEEQLQNINGNKTIINQLIDSNVLSASMLGRRVKNLKQHPIVLTFKKPEHQKEDDTLECQFWNQSLGKIFLQVHLRFSFEILFF